MAEIVRYQVFLSPTYTDLKEERAEVIQALWELDCIPTGMEAFLASSASQWDVIKKVIDDCDYYILIIGGRYGSLTDDEISFTEKEYDYAKSISIPILAFVHAKPDHIPAMKTEQDPELREKLKKFRERVMEEYPVREWSTPDQLGSVASRSLVQEIRRSPRLGWVRNGDRSPSELLERIAQLTAENASLNQKLAFPQTSSPMLLNLSQGDEMTTIWGVVHTSNRVPEIRKKWSVEESWNRIFVHLAPILQREAGEKQISSYLAAYAKVSSIYPFDPPYMKDIVVSSNCVNRIIVQLRALGLVERGVRPRRDIDTDMYWRLSEQGDALYVSLLAKRSGASKPVTLSV